jgi:hypothetical protein
MLSSIQEIREIRETPAGRQHRKNGGLGVMASDGIESKSIAVGLGPEVDLTDETGARVIEISGVIKWFDVAG